MAIPLIFNWPAIDLAGVCALQTTTGAGSLIINGTLASAGATNVAAVSLPNIYRAISITSTGNLSAINFTITGTGITAGGVFGVTSQTISGPNNNTVSTTDLFTTVTSVTVNAAVGTAVRVGTGSTGISYFYGVNHYATVANLGIQVNVSGTPTNITYSLRASMYASTDPGFIVFSPVVAMTGAQTSQFANLTLPLRIAYINVTASATDGALTGILLQQGIT